MSITLNIGRQLKRFRDNESGQFAIMTAIMAIPLLIGVGYVIDQNRYVRHKSDLSSAIDSAALAAVMQGHLSPDERASYAQEFFDKNYKDDYPVDLDIKSTADRIDIDAQSYVPTLISGMMGKAESGVKKSTAAVITRESVVCVLALDPKGNKSIEFKDNARFNSPSCAVQANSSNPNAIWSSTPHAPIAESFCSVGGSHGTFFPYVNTNCSPVEDPYADLEIPEPGQRCDERDNVKIVGNNGNGRGEMMRQADLEFSDDDGDGEEESVIPDNTILSPGIYCKGIKIEGANVTLEPGVYHVWGNLEFTEHARVRGDRVTFILKGEKNKVKIEHGAQVYLRAPMDGPTAGLVFWQIHLNFRKYIMGRATPPPEGPTAKSEIKSGGGLQIIGTAYFPNHILEVSSDNSVASRAPATSFIAYRLKFAKEANLTVNVNHQAGGIPPMVPRSDDGARLVR